jgi:hypothetical protein
MPRPHLPCGLAASSCVAVCIAEWLAVWLVVARTWLSIRVDLISGQGEEHWPRPGPIFAAAHSHEFSQLADARVRLLRLLTHLCTVGQGDRPGGGVGIVPRSPLPYWGE